MRCSCTPGYVCRGNCILAEIKNQTSENNPKKREYASTYVPVFEKNASNKQKQRMDFANIAVDIATFAYKKCCCSKNCILDLVKRYSSDKVAEAVHLARKNVYHTNANFAHSELRNLLNDKDGEVFAYFDHQKLLSSFADTPSRIKVIISTIPVNAF